VGVVDAALEKLRRSASSTDSPLRPTTTQRAGDAPPASGDSVKRISIDFEHLRALRYLPEVDEETRFADYYHGIKRTLIQKVLGANAAADLRLILVCSALPGEGKTFTTLNLALSMAREHDISVLLVDADLPRGEMSAVLGVQDEPGLTDSLIDQNRDVESLILRTDVRGLDVLPAGRRVAGTAELLASARMARVATRLSTSNPRRLALFDSPPLLVSSAARAMLQTPGQIILVVRAGQTPRQALLDAVAYIDKKKLCGLVLNDAHASGGDGYYYYYGQAGYAVIGTEASAGNDPAV